MTCSQLFNILENLHRTRLYHFSTAKFPAVKRFVMTSNHEENESDRYWCVVRMHQFGIRYDEFSQSIIRHISIFMWSPRDTSSRERPSETTGWKTVLPSLPSELNISPQRCKRRKWDFGAVCQASGSITESEQSYNPREVIRPIKETTVTLCHLSPVPD